MQLNGGGFIALLLFLAWLGFTFRQAIHARAQVSAPLVGLALAFAVGCLFNSMLLDFHRGALLRRRCWLGFWRKTAMPPSRMGAQPA